MKAIWKYAVTLDDLVKANTPEGVYDVQMAPGARVISVGDQLTPDGEAVVIWAIVDPDLAELAGKETRTFRFMATGTRWTEYTGPDLGQFCGTVQFDQYRLVLHVFDLGDLSRIAEGPRTIGTP